MNKLILDACCGGRTFWFDKENPNVLFQDIRKEEKGFCKERPEFTVQPDVMGDFRSMSYPDKSFKLVVFDPPHMLEGKAGNGWMVKKYGSLSKATWKYDLKRGFDECWRVLEDNGILIFKWSSISVKIGEVLKLFEKRPLFGHPTGKNGNTMWVCFMKLPESTCFIQSTFESQTGGNAHE